MKTKIGGIILAAGASARMLRPKALLPWGSSTFIQEIVKIFREAGLSSVVVVIRDDEAGAAIKALLTKTALIATNPDPERGMLSSLQVGARALMTQDIKQALITPVDQPQLTVALCQQLCGALVQGQWAVATHQGEWGHPYACADLAEILELTAEQTAATLLREKSPILIEGGPQVLFNMNTPEEYQAAYLQKQKERYE